MPSGNGQVDLLFFQEIHRLLGLGNGRRGFHRAAEQNGHSVGDAAVDAAVMIGRGHDTAVFQPKRIIASAAAALCQSEAVAKLHALNTAQRKQRVGKKAFYAVKPRLAYAAGHAQHGGLHHAAHAVLLGLCSKNGFPHGFALTSIQRRKG